VRRLVQFVVIVRDVVLVFVVFVLAVLAVLVFVWIAVSAVSLRAVCGDDRRDGDGADGSCDGER
jgi:hypothetical protein